MKSPQFFSHEATWTRGLEWYSSLFTGVPLDLVTGEASASYTSTQSEKSAERMASVVPTARLVYVLRHPLERIRSHYRHEVQRGREKDPVAAALSEVANGYVGQSLYWARLRAYASCFSREQICVVRLEDLVSESECAWTRVLRHLGLSPIPCPRTTHNVTADKPQYSRLLTRMHRNYFAKSAVRAMPAPLRRMTRVLLTKDDAEYRRRLERSSDPIPVPVEEEVWADISNLEAWLGIGRLWSREPA
jgi:hypothetical protein